MAREEIPGTRRCSRRLQRIRPLKRRHRSQGQRNKRILPTGNTRKPRNIKDSIASDPMRNLEPTVHEATATSEEYPQIFLKKTGVLVDYR